MNFKRKKSKRVVRCTLCTKYRWIGNNTGRRTIRDQRNKAKADSQDTA